MSGRQEVMKRFVAGYKSLVPDIKNIDEILTREKVEKMIHAIAYHEAGHAAIHAFLGDDYSHFDSLSIIPENGSMGRLSRARMMPFDFSHNGDPAIMDILKERAKSRIILSLAGPVAEAIAKGEYSPHLIDEENPEIWDCLSFDTIEDWRAGCDMGKAWTMAEAIQSRPWPAYRIMRQLETWTEEMLRTPDVWQVVETLAEMLINKGEILEDDYYPVADEICMRKFLDRFWARRMIPKRFLKKNKGEVTT